jgi:Transposase IS66 family
MQDMGVLSFWLGKPMAMRVFHHLYEGGRIVEAACWAHVRRKFYDIQANGSSIATEGIGRKEIEG